MAVLAAMIFSWTAVLFTIASRRLGTGTVNLLRLPLGALCLALCHLAVFGRLWPEHLTAASHFWIGLSGVVGLAAGDSALFKSFTLVGPRRGMTLMSAAPVFTVLVAWSLLDERLDVQALLGIVVVIFGVVLATTGRDDGGGEFHGLSRRTRRVGLLLALVAAAGQGLGSAFAKLGMSGNGVEGTFAGGVDPLGATLVRMTWAAIVYWLCALVRLDLRAVRRRLRDRTGSLVLGGAIFCGPFGGVWISLVAIKHAEAGVAQVLLGMVPIFVIVPAWLVYRDRPSPQSVIGVLVAVAGGAVLFLR